MKRAHVHVSNNKIKNMSEVIKDFGNYNIPDGWDKLTLKQYQEIERLYSDKDKEVDIRDVLSLLTAHSKDDIDQLPIEFLEMLLQRLNWLYETPVWPESSNKITIDGEEYIINIMEKLKTGEYIASDTVLKSDPHNYAAILAILCRKQGEKYDSKFEAEVLNKRIEMFEKQPVMKIYSLIAFFLNLYMILEIPSQLSIQMQDAINQERENIQNLRKNGDLSILSTKSAMRKLRKLEKSLKCI